MKNNRLLAARDLGGGGGIERLNLSMLAVVVVGYKFVVGSVWGDDRDE